MLKNATISKGMVVAAEPRASVTLWLDRAAVMLLIALAALSAVFAVLHAFAYFDEARYYALIQAGMIGLTLVQLAGLSVMRERPLPGGALVLLPGLVLALLWSFHWYISIGVLAVTAYGVYRAFQLGRQSRRTAA